MSFKSEREKRHFAAKERNAEHVGPGMAKGEVITLEIASLTQQITSSSGFRRWLLPSARLVGLVSYLPP
jgi:hypothetical protein